MWGPPREVIAGTQWPGSVESVVAALEDRLGTRIWVNRLINSRVDVSSERIVTVVEADLKDPSWAIPANGRWARVGDLEGLRLHDLESRKILERFLEGADDVPTDRSPWNRRRWIEGVIGWLSTLPIGEVLEIHQVKQWAISSALRVVTGDGIYYFKVSAPLPLFVNEAVVVPSLSRILPDFVEAPVAVDTERGWILVPDLGETDTEQDPNPGRLATFYRSAARLHTESIPSVDELLAVGCHDRRPEKLPEHAEALLADDRIMGRLDPSDREILKSADLAGQCERLSSMGVPSSLVHGDLHPGNAVFNRDRLSVFDWSDACVSHPLFDLQFLDQLEDPQRSALEASYLQEWSQVCEPDLMRAAAAAARVPRAIHHAVSYRAIANGVETAARDELDLADRFLGLAAALIRKGHQYA